MAEGVVESADGEGGLVGVPERARGRVLAELRARLAAGPVGLSAGERAVERSVRVEEEVRWEAEWSGAAPLTAGLWSRRF